MAGLFVFGDLHTVLHTVSQKLAGAVRVQGGQGGDLNRDLGRVRGFSET